LQDYFESDYSRAAKGYTDDKAITNYGLVDKVGTLFDIGYIYFNQILPKLKKQKK
jgi:hypothetical protein